MSTTPTSLALMPIKGGSACSLELGSDLLSLRADDGRVLLMLPREEAAAHVRFAWRLPFGQTVSFVVIEGLRAYTYRATPEMIRALIHWLPLRTSEAIAGELRLHGVGAVLLGCAVLLFPHAELWPYVGVGVVVVGCASVLHAARLQYGINAALFACLGLGLLFGPQWIAPQANLLWPTAVGAALLLWAIQQASLLAPQHLVDRSQAMRSAPRRILKSSSRFHIVMAAITLGCAAPFAALAMRHAQDFTLLMAFTALAAVTVGIAAAIVLRGRHSYRELQLGGQWTLLVLYFLAYGLVWQTVLFAVDPVPYPLGPVYNFHLPAVFVPLIVVILGFNVLLRKLISTRMATDEDE